MLHLNKRSEINLAQYRSFVLYIATTIKVFFFRDLGLEALMQNTCFYYFKAVKLRNYTIVRLILIAGLVGIY